MAEPLPTSSEYSLVASLVVGGLGLALLCWPWIAGTAREWLRRVGELAWDPDDEDGRRV